MPGQKRSELLTDTEIDRLINRRNMKDTKKRAANDIRVKKKLSAWLENTSNVKLILNNLPEDQLQETDDTNIYFLLDIVDDFLKVKNFYPIEGEATNPNDWRTILDVGVKSAHSRPTEKIDIARAAMMLIFVNGIVKRLGSRNPIIPVISLIKLYKDPELRSRLSDDEKKAVEKCLDAIKDTYDIDPIGCDW